MVFPRKKKHREPLTLVGHLFELRGRLLACMIALAAGVAIGFSYAGDMVGALLVLPGELVYISPGEAFHTHVRLAVLAGFMLALPMFLYQAAAFILPGLTREEATFLYIGVPASLLLLFAGVCFSYAVVLPVTYRFLIDFGTDRLAAMISVGSYISFALGVVIPFGVIFQLPLLVWVLTGIGLVTPEFFRQNRKYAFLCIFVISALLTPPDVVSQVLMAAPLLLLYEISIFVSKAVAWRRRKREILS